jgi:hypothetical protein
MSPIDHSNPSEAHSPSALSQANHIFDMQIIQHGNEILAERLQRGEREAETNPGLVRYFKGVGIISENALLVCKRTIVVSMAWNVDVNEAGALLDL